MSKQVWKPGTLLSPAPAVMVSCGTMEKPNIITIAWTGIINSHPPMTYISVRPERYSHKLISESGEFAINLTSAKLLYAADYCGVKSGAQVDKFTEMKLNPVVASRIAAPVIDESPLSLECKVTKVMQLGSHDMFLAEIVSVLVDDKLVDESGRLCLEKAGITVYSHGEYFEMGKKIGSFGYSVKKKTTRKKQ